VSVRGVSRASYAELSERLDAEHITSAAVAARLGDELFAVTGLLDTEPALRRALSDPGKPAAEKAAVTADLLHDKVTPRAESLVAAASEAHWASPGDLADAIEQLAIEAKVIGAELDGTLDEMEDELFRFGRVVAAQPELRSALSSTWLPQERKQALLGALLEGKVSASTLSLINQMVAHPRGRSLSAALELCAEMAAQRRQMLIAEVRSAVDLSATQRSRLASALSGAYGHQIHLNVIVDPSVVGGLSVQIGDELIDGTTASQLAAVRRKLTE
jgi:F-type H+-transporting ATPase subunit delta